MKISASAFALLCALALSSCASVSVLPRSELRLDPEVIESKLLSGTPVGTSEDQVLRHLQSKGLKPTPIWRGNIEVAHLGNDYPASSFSRIDLGDYGLIFETSVEALYLFGQDQRLLEISVRKSTDSF